MNKASRRIILEKHEEDRQLSRYQCYHSLSNVSEVPFSCAMQIFFRDELVIGVLCVIFQDTADQL